MNVGLFVSMQALPEGCCGHRVAGSDRLERGKHATDSCSALNKRDGVATFVKLRGAVAIVSLMSNV